MEEALEDYLPLGRDRDEDLQRLLERAPLDEPLRQYLEQLVRGAVPETAPQTGQSMALFSSSLGCTRFHAEHVAREFVCRRPGVWPMIDRAWVAELAGRIGARSSLDPMAGSGYLARELRDQGVTVDCSDIAPPIRPQL